MDVRNVGTQSFARMAHEGIRQADLELGKTSDSKPAGYVSPRVRKQLETATRDIATLSGLTVDSFQGQAASTDPSPWNRRSSSIGFLSSEKNLVSEGDAARAVHDMAGNALAAAAHKPLPVQIGIYQGTLLAISGMSQFTLNHLGAAAQSVLEGKSIRIQTDQKAVNQAAAPSAPPKDGDASTPVAKPKGFRLSERMVDRGGQALADAGVAALARAASTIGDAAAIGVLGNPALTAGSRLAALAACMPPAVPSAPAA